MRWRPIHVLSLLVTFCLLTAFTHHARAAGLLVADGGFGGRWRSRSTPCTSPSTTASPSPRSRRSSRTRKTGRSRRCTRSPCRAGRRCRTSACGSTARRWSAKCWRRSTRARSTTATSGTKRDPGLLEQTDYRTFEMRVFPIAPRAEQKVQIDVLPGTGLRPRLGDVRLPAGDAHARRTCNARTDGGQVRAQRWTSNPRSRSSQIESPSHGKDFAVAKHNDTYYQASLEARGGDLSRGRRAGVITLARPRTGHRRDHIKAWQGRRLLLPHADGRRRAAADQQRRWTTSSSSTSPAA